MSAAMVEGLQWLSGEFSVDRQEWRQHHKGGDMLLDGALSKGYVNTKGGRFAVSDAGRRMLADLEPVEEEG